MNVSYVKIKSYELRTINYELLKQTQSNPIYGEPCQIHNMQQLKTVIPPMRSIVRNFAFCLLIFDFYNDTTCSG